MVAQLSKGLCKWGLEVRKNMEDDAWNRITRDSDANAFTVTAATKALQRFIAEVLPDFLEFGGELNAQFNAAHRAGRVLGQQHSRSGRSMLPALDMIVGST
jgi:hypothetical protein